MHGDPPHNCLFGCVGENDAQDHYFQCPHLFALIRFLIMDTSSDPLTRWAIANPNRKTLQCVCCAFSGYHAVKAQIRCSGRHLSNTVDGPCSGAVIRGHWSAFVEAFRAEAGELGIQCHAFSLPSFLNFLMHGDCLSIADNAGT